MAERALDSALLRERDQGRPRRVEGSLTWPRIDTRVWLGLVLLASAGLRFVGLDWDELQHLHPDERFLTMVETAIRWPRSLGEYFDTAQSPLSPYNRNFGLYVYGTFPLYLVKRVALLINQSGYDQVHLVGRALSAAFDVGTTAMIFVIGRRLYGSAAGLVAAGLYGLMALPIQQAHFFTVDGYANFFAALAAYCALNVIDTNRRRDYALLGLTVGLGVACKISMFVLGLFGVLAVGIVVYRSRESDSRLTSQTLEQAALRLMLAGAVALVTFRVVQPIAFEGPTILNFTPNDQWLANMAEIRGLLSGERDFPPGHQWTDRAPIWFPLSNMVVWGMGVPLGVAAWLGWALCALELVRRRRLEHTLPVVFIGLVFLYQGTQWVKSMRYLLHIYPFLALTAAYALTRLWFAGRSGATRSRLGRLIVVAVVGLTALYALAFTSIYTRPHSRVDASRWIYANVPAGSVLANEHWDDPLPLRMDGKDGFGGIYRGLMLNNYDEDTPKKLDEMMATLRQADYVILSSNRLYDSIPRLPMRYPVTTRYYQLLFAEQLGFQKVAEFTSYPGLLGLSLPDQGAEEAFSVYDHPKVTIFKKAESFDAGRVRAALEEDIDWEGILRLRPDQATRARTGLLLSPSDRTSYETAVSWRRLFDPSGLAARAPLLVWWVALQIMGLLIMPIAFIACRDLLDRGFALTKPLGWLMVTWLVWIAGSLHLAAFGTSLILVAFVALGLVSGLAALTLRREIVAFVKQRCGLLLLEEAVFTVLFMGFIGVRMANPDLWHPVMGGEKPMDFAYLNAVIRSPYFPPYDPWFAGGYVNYYYFGFVLVAVLTVLTGIVPWVAYNLAVPTLFALTGLGAFAVALHLSQPSPRWERWRVPVMDAGPSRAALAAGLLASLFVVILGNLGELRLIVGGLMNVGKSALTVPLPGLVGALRVLDGTREVLINGRSLPFRTEWWYWNATRLIPHPQTEAGPITEFPYFTFLYGDLHAHMMALPFTLVALALSVTLIRGWRPGMSPGHRALDVSALLTLGLLALVVGALWPLNTWDFPTYAVLIVVGLAVRLVAMRGRVEFVDVVKAGTLGGLVAGLSYLLFLPFHRAYATAYSSIELWTGSRTTLDAYVTIHGLFLFVILTFLVRELLSRGRAGSVTRELQAMLRHAVCLPRYLDLRDELVEPTSPHTIGLSASGLGLLLVLALLALGQGALALAVVVLGLAALLILGPDHEPRRRFVLSLIALGAALTLAVEVIVLKGDVSRMNTVFKFYLQVWTLWAVAAAVALPALLNRQALGGAESSGEAPSRRATRLPGWWRPALAALVAACALYPVFATYVRAHDRFERSEAVTLDGTAYMQDSSYADRNQQIALRWDRDAIQWLLQNVDGSPVIVEAVTPLYHWGSRVSVYTGMPTIIGWDWHQKQQRAILPGDVVDRRVRDVELIYTSPSIETTHNLLRRYDARFIYLGRQEELYYPAASQKLARYEGSEWVRVYENPEVIIYEVRQ